MLVEVTFVRDPHAITQLAPETPIVPTNLIVGTFVRHPRAIFSEGIITAVGGGATAFTNLVDVPPNYVGAGGKAVAVKGTEDGLEFVPFPSGGAPASAHYVTTQSEGGLSNEFNLGSLASGILGQNVAAGVATPVIAIPDTDYVTPGNPAMTNDRTANALRTLTAKGIDPTADPTNGQVMAYDLASDLWKPKTPAATTLIRGMGFGAARASGISTGKLKGWFTCPYVGTISGWTLAIPVGTITVKFWKLAGALPTAANSINTAGVSSSGTYIRSFTLTDFITLAVAIGDVIVVEVVALTGVITDFSGSLEITV
jgi:hypothetical protein